MPLTTANTHPFLADGLCFAHNGYAWPAATLDTLVRDAGAPTPLGDTDSERYFSLVRAGLARGRAPDALRQAAQRITARASSRRSTACCLVPDALYALAWWHAPGIRAQPDGETERDYRLWYRVDRGPRRGRIGGHPGARARLAGAAQPQRAGGRTGHARDEAPRPRLTARPWPRPASGVGCASDPQSEHRRCESGASDA